MPLPLKSICLFTSFWLQGISHLHPIPESSFCEPLNLADLRLCSFEITALHFGASCCLLDESCSSLLSWNILTLPFGQGLTLSAKFMRELSERENQDQTTASLEKNVALKQTQGNVTYFYIFYVKKDFPALATKNKHATLLRSVYSSYYFAPCYSQSSFRFITLVIAMQ